MLPRDLPELAIVEVLTAGGPYGAGDALSIAFTTPTIGRLVAHGASTFATTYAAPVVPDTISVRVTHPAPPYARDAILTLSFVDPRVARIHPAGGCAVDERLSSSPAVPVAVAEERSVAIASVSAATDSLVLPTLVVEESRNAAAPHTAEMRDVEVAHSPSRKGECDIVDVPTDPRNVVRSPNDSDVTSGGVRVRLHWSPDRTRRFVQVVDKLFTVDRLGWYRHAFAMRLLIPDEISCGDAVSDIETMRHLVALRAAAVETLGRPMLAAFMPSFTVTPEWLDSLDSAAAARALAGLRDAIVPHAGDDIAPSLPGDPFVTTGIIARRELVQQPASTVEAVLPMLIASHATDTTLSERLGEYRRTLIEVFGQTAQSAETVRLNQMAQPNHALDDRLWQLVGIVGESLGGLAVA